MWQAFTKFIVQFCAPDIAALEVGQQLFKTVHIPKGSYFIRTGEVGSKLGFIYQGLLRTFYVHDNGEEITYCFAMENAMEASFESFISEKPSALSIVAIEDTTLLVITKPDLNSLLDKYLFWNQVSRKLTEQEYLKMTQHADESKTTTAKTKYLNLLKQQPQLLQRVPLHYIASYLGISSRHLTRMRKAITEK
jgi:CRP-like cAMP-binding protein